MMARSMEPFRYLTNVLIQYLLQLIFIVKECDDPERKLSVILLYPKYLVLLPQPTKVKP